MIANWLFSSSRWRLINWSRTSMLRPRDVERRGVDVEIITASLTACFGLFVCRSGRSIRDAYSVVLNYSLCVRLDGPTSITSHLNGISSINRLALNIPMLLLYERCQLFLFKDPPLTVPAVPLC